MNKPFTFVFGDIHGCHEEFYELIVKTCKTAHPGVPFPIAMRDIHFVSVGDLVDRGPDSHKVLDLFALLPHKTLVMGNHELKVIRKGFVRDNPSLDPEVEMVEIPLTEDAKRILSTGVPFYTFESDKDFGDAGRFTYTYMVVHGGIYPAWLEQYGQSIPNPDSWSNKEAKKWQRTSMTRFINTATGQMVSLGAEKPEDVYWAELYGRGALHAHSSEGYKYTGPRHWFVDRQNFPVKILYGHQPTPEIRKADRRWSTNLDQGGVFGNVFRGRLFAQPGHLPDNLAWTDIIVPAKQKYSKLYGEE